MYSKYQLEVFHNGSYVFEGAFISLNKAIKIASLFDDDCKFHLVSLLHNRSFDDYEVKMMRKEFKNGEIFI